MLCVWFLEFTGDMEWFVGVGMISVAYTLGFAGWYALRGEGLLWGFRVNVFGWSTFYVYDFRYFGLFLRYGGLIMCVDIYCVLVGLWYFGCGG